MNLWHFLSGMAELELTSADPAQALQSLADGNVCIYHPRCRNDLTVSFRILRQDHKTAESICRKRGEQLRLVGEIGLYCTGRRILKRPMLLAGVILFLVLYLYLPTRVLFVQTEGNRSVPVNQILEAAEFSGVRFGVSRKSLRSEAIKNSLLSLIPALQWAGVNTSGCVATISVREREPAQEEMTVPVSNIVALRDGIVIECTVTRGKGLCEIGHAVAAGDILISGSMDCGIALVSTRAEGEVFARTIRETVAVTPLKVLLPMETGEYKQSISLIIGKKRINLWKDSGIWDTTCGRMYEEYYVTLPGGFSLPLGLAVDTCVVRTAVSHVLSHEKAEALLRDWAKDSLTGQMTSGIILSKEETFRPLDDGYRMEGRYLCTEMIGREQPEEIGDNYGKIS